MRIHARQSEDAVDVEDCSADEFSEGAPEANFAEVVSSEFVPGWPPGPFTGWFGSFGALEEAG